MRKETIKQQLYQELKIKNEVSVEGVDADPSIFRNLDLGGKYQEQVHLCFEMDHETHEGFSLPTGYQTPGGLNVPFKWDRRSNYKIAYDGTGFSLTYKGNALFPIVFDKRPKYYDLNASDGTSFHTVAGYSVGYVKGGAISVAYSNECALKEKGQDCLFCNINATKSTYAESEGISWKNPMQIAEAVEAAYRLDGATHMTLTGGFIPERREVDYYLDVAEAVQEVMGLNDFNGTAVIGAPVDLQIIDKYRDAGFRTLSINLEVWDQNYFNVILPGKATQCGGRTHWLKALEYAANVFGKGRVRTSFVTGIEPKAATLGGVEYLASIGILSLAGAWTVNPGSALEGHRTPEPAWHLDMAYRCHSIFKKYGFGYDDYFDISPFPHFLVNDLFAIDEERLPIFASEKDRTAV
ncbi:MAG: radical SAM protein [Ethanoligenens sp.]